MELAENIEWRKASDRKAALITLAFCLAWAAFGLLSVELYSDDDLGHYMIARYSHLHPHLFLDIWGRPLFTVLYAVGSQFGLAGARLTSTVLAAAVIWFTYIYARESGIRKPWMVAMLLVVMPRFSSMAWNLDTGMALCLALSAGLALYAKGRYAAAAAAISLAPAGRPEGVLFIMIFGIVLLYRRKWRAVPFLFLGLALWDAAGLLMSGDPLWLLHNQPWTAPYPEKFGFDHYFKRFTEITGPAHVPFFLAGLVVSVKRFKKGDNAALAAMWLIYFVFMVVVVWRGAFSTVGLTRYFNGTTPLVALLTLAGINRVLDEEFERLDIAATAVVAVMAGYLFYSNGPETLVIFGISTAVFAVARILTARSPLAGRSRAAYFMIISSMVVIAIFFTISFRPAPLTFEHARSREAADWYLKNAKGKPVLSSNAWFAYFTDKDVYDEGQIAGVNEVNMRKARPGTVLIWEPHYAGGERYGKVDLDRLMADPEYQLLASDKNEFIYIFGKTGAEPPPAGLTPKDGENK